MNRPARHEIDPTHFRKVMGRFATGVTVVTARSADRTYGMTANAFMSGSLDPPLCVISVAKRAHMHQCLIEAEHFAVNVLAHSQVNLATHFSGRVVPGLTVRFLDVDGVPTLPDASARITARIAASHDCGDHTIFVGHIAGMEADDRAPLLYHAGHYAAVVPTHGPEIPQPEFW